MSNENLQLEKLTEIFRQAGAKEPGSWASSQINEGINQIGRFSFLKAASSEILKEDDFGYLDELTEINNPLSADSGSQMITAIKEMVKKGVSKESIIDLIRVVQFQTLWHVCCTIDNVYENDTPINQWGLFEIDDDGNALNQIGSLHESLYEFDPSAREMRPRNEE